MFLVYTKKKELMQHIAKELLRYRATAGENIDCPICLCHMTESIANITHCGHMCCSLCLDRLKNCSICRTPIVRPIPISRTAKAKIQIKYRNTQSIRFTTDAFVCPDECRQLLEERNINIEEIDTIYVVQPIFTNPILKGVYMSGNDLQFIHWETI